MNIAFDHRIFSSQAYGGISRYFVLLAENLEKIGENPRIYSPVHRNKYLSNHTSLNHGAYLENFPHKTTVLINIYNFIAGGLQITYRQPDIVHETYYSKSVFPHNAPIVITIHDMIPELFASQYQKSNLLVINKRKSIERADHIICVSESTKKDLIEIYNPPEEQVSVVYHGFELFPEIDKGVISEYSCSDQPFLLYVGNRSGYKNFNKFIEAYTTSEHLKKEYDVIAFGGSSFSRGEKEMLQRFGISKKVHHRFGNDRVLGEYYRNASALVFPSLYEGFGMPVLEAMAHGCPVIASNTSSIPEVAGQAAVLFDPTDLDSMRSSMEKVLNSKNLKHALIIRGFDRIENFSWEKCASQTINVYKKVLAH